jgi:diguanylate cyclase
MSLWTRSRPGPPPRAAAGSLQGITTGRPPSEIDALLASLDQLIATRHAAIRSQGAKTDDEVRANREHGFAVFYIDLRRSDRTGALAGVGAARDALASIRQRIEGLLRPGDRFALYGVEDLLVVLPEVDSAGRALLVASRLIQALVTPQREGQAQARVRPAIGCALFPSHGVDGETLIAAADRACRKARGTEEGYCIADRGEEAKYEVHLSRELEAALGANELEVWLQPQFDLRTQTFDAAEALIRWPRQAGMAPVAPITLVELAEKDGHMPSLTLFVLNTVLRQSANLRQRGIDLKIAVNVSASMLTDPNLPRTVQQVLELWDVAPDRLTLEVTENTLMQDVERSLKILHELKAVGTRLSLDDFGTGYSSFAYLRRMPLDELKIDQLFVRNLKVNNDGDVSAEQRGDVRIVRSIIDIAHNFDLHTVAEGVEDANTMKMLESMGCDVIQGYHTCRPMPIARLEDWWREHATVAA